MGRGRRSPLREFDLSHLVVAPVAVVARERQRDLRCAVARVDGHDESMHQLSIFQFEFALHSFREIGGVSHDDQRHFFFPVQFRQQLRQIPC